MGQNIGPLDRVTRVVIGVLLVAYRLIGQFDSVFWDLATITGGLWIWEGLTGFCLLYGLLGWNTRRKRAK